jgi:katanin p80 WD40 repeat-containing subunit B1
MSAAPFTQAWTFPVSSSVSAVRLAGDGKVLVGAGSNAHVFDCRNPEGFHIELEGLASPISSLCADKGCRRVVAGTDGGSLRLWDSETQQVVRTFSNCHRASITSCDFHPYGEYIVTGSRDSHCRVWDTRKKSCLQVYKPASGAGAFVEVVRFGPDGRWAVSGDSKGVMRICDVLAGKQLHELPSVSSPVASISFHPSRCNIAVSGCNGDLAVWDAEKMEQVLSSSEPGCSLCDWTEQHLVWSGGGGKLEKLSTSDWRRAATLRCSWPQLDDLRCDPDGTIFAAQKQVISVGVTMIGAPGKNRNAPNAAAAAVAPQLRVPNRGAAAGSAGGGGAVSKAVAQQQLVAPAYNNIPPVDENVASPVPSSSNVANRMLAMQQQQFAAAAAPPAAAVVHTPPPATTLESYPLSSPQPQKPVSRVEAPMRARGAVAAAAAAAAEPKTDDDLVDEALERSDKMTALLQRRVTHTRVFRSLWQQHPDRALAHLEQSLAQDRSDCGAVIDFFICLHQQRVKEKLTAEHVASVLRLVQMVLQDHRIEPFVLSAMQALRYVNSKFRGRIEETLRGASAAAPGVDLSMESRLEKARQCYRLMIEVRALVTQYVARPDAVGEEARVLARDLPSG